MMYLYQKMATRNVLSCLLLFLLLVPVGALGDDDPGEHLTDNTSKDYITHMDLTYEYSTDLAHSGNTVFSFAEDNVCHGLWDYPWSLPWMHQATVTGNATFDMGMFGISLMGPSCHRTFSNIPNLFVAYIEQSPRVVDNLSIIFLFGILLAISVGTSAIVRRNSPRGIKRRKILTKKHRSRLLAVCAVTRRAIHDAQQSVPVDAHGLSSTFFTTDYLKLVWTTLCRSWTIKRLEANQQRLSAKVASLSKEISTMKKQIYPERPRRWQRLARSRGSPERKVGDSASDGPAINLPACSSLASRWSSPSRRNEDSTDGVFNWVLLRAWPVLFFLADCAGLLRYEQLLCNLLDIVSAWYLLEVLRTLLEWTNTHEDPHEAMFDRVVFAMPTTVLIVVGAGVTILMHLGNVTNAEPRRVQPRRRQATKRNVHAGSGRRAQYAQHSPERAVAAPASATASAEATAVTTATATAEVAAITTDTATAGETAVITATVAAHAEMGEVRPPAPLDLCSATAATKQTCAYAGIDQDDQPTAVIAWMQRFHVTTTDSLRADRDQHAAESTELANRLGRTAAFATASDATIATLATKASADRAASVAANLALEEVKDQLSRTVQERDSARTTAGDLAKKLATTTAAAKIKIEEAHRRELAVRGEMEAKQRECVEASGTIAGLRNMITGLNETIAGQCAVATTTAAELELTRQKVISATNADTATAPAERATAAAAAAAAAAVAVADSSELARVSREAAVATARASVLARQRDTTNRERDTLVIELRAALEKKSTAATAAAKDLAAAATTAADLRAEVEVQTTVATTAKTALAAAQQEVDRATSSAVEAEAGRRAAENERDNSLAATARMKADLEVQATAAITANTALEAAQQEVSRWVNEAAARRYSAAIQRDAEIAAAAELRENLAVQINATTTATTELAAQQQASAARQQEVDRATSSAIEAEARCRAAENERDSALAATAKVQAQLALQTTAATTAKTALAAAQQEVDRATSSEIEAVAGRRAAENERDNSLAATARMKADLEVQATAAITANTTLEAAQQEVSRWVNEAAARRYSAEIQRDAEIAAAAELRKTLAVQINATTTATTELAAQQQASAARQQEVDRATSSAIEAEARCRAAENERDSALAATAKVQAQLALQTTAATTAKTALAAAQQEVDRATSSEIKAVAGRRAAENERDNSLAATARMKADLEVQATAATTANTALEAAQQEVSWRVNEAAARRYSAEIQRDAEIAAVAELRETLAVQINATTTATTELAAQQQASAARQQEVDRATLSAIEAEAKCRAAENERDSALAATAKVQAQVALQTTAATTAKTALAAAQQEVDRATSSEIEAVAGRRAAENERDNSLAATARMKADLEVQATAATTANTALEAAQQEVSWRVNEAAASRYSAEIQRDAEIAAVAELREKLAVQITATTTATTELAAQQQASAARQQEVDRATSWMNEAAARFHALESELVATRQEVSRAVSLEKATAHKLNISEQERCRAEFSFKKKRIECDHAAAAVNNIARQLSSVMEECDRATAAANNIASQLSSVLEDRAKLQEKLDGMHFKRGPLALEETSAAAIVTGAITTPNAEAEGGATAARKKTRFSYFAPSRGVNAAAAAITSAAAAESTATAASLPPPPSVVAVVPKPPARYPFGPANTSGKPGESVAGASPIICFYRDGGRSRSAGGEEGPSLAEIVEKPDEWLEATHDYVQWVFPTQQTSGFVVNAPVLTDDDLAEIKREGDKPQRKMLSALGRMLIFFGLNMVRQGNEVLVVKGGNFDPNAKWMGPSNHNSLRLTRMITSLRLFELGEYADALQAFLLSELPNNHPSRTFWQKA